MQDRHQPFVDRHGLGEAPGLGQAEDRLALFGEHVGHARDPALGADRDAFQDHVVQAREQHEAIAHFIAHVDEAAGVAGGVLEAHHVVAVGQGNQDVRGDVVFVDRRVVVDHQRHVGVLGHIAIVLGGLERLGAVDQRRHQHHPVDTGLVHRVGHLGRLYAGELGHAADHRDPAARGVDGDFGDGDLFFGGQRGVFTHRTTHHQARDAIADHVGNHLVGFLQVDREVVVELSGDRREDAAPVYVLAHGVLRLFIVFRIRY
ncbi:hypothetical protein D3C80_976590 [compost metagenome]